MEHLIDSAVVLIETCPACGSVDVRAREPRWFAVELDRRADLDDAGPVVRVEFGCRDCGWSWT